jgi:hypothetical protein
MAEGILRAMGPDGFGYMDWAASTATPPLARRIREVRSSIADGLGPYPTQWPSIEQCMARLYDDDFVVSLMAAQILCRQAGFTSQRTPPHIGRRIAELLAQGRTVEQRLRHQFEPASFSSDY